MAINPPSPMSLGEKLQALPKFYLYAVLFVITSVPLFFSIPVPNKPEDASISLYVKLMSIPKGSTVLLASDWTNSTRGESMGSFEALIKILQDRGLKCAIYSTADPQAPRVARDSIERMNATRRTKGLPVYERWNQWVSLGYFPSAEGQLSSIAGNLRKAFSGKTEVDPATGKATDVFQSPVLKDIKAVGDLPVLLTITASKTSDLTVERLYGKVPLAFLVTGVMGPETQVYYASKQAIGVAAGVKGVYDLETLMEKGVNTKDGVKSELAQGEVPPLSDIRDVKGKGTAYFPTLHFALTLLILSVVIGNVGMFLARRGAQS